MAANASSSFHGFNSLASIGSGSGLTGINSINSSNNNNSYNNNNNTFQGIGSARRHNRGLGLDGAGEFTLPPQRGLGDSGFSRGRGSPKGRTGRTGRPEFSLYDILAGTCCTADDASAHLADPLSGMCMSTDQGVAPARPRPSPHFPSENRSASEGAGRKEGGVEVSPADSAASPISPTLSAV